MLGVGTEVTRRRWSRTPGREARTPRVRLSPPACTYKSGPPAGRSRARWVSLRIDQVIKIMKIYPCRPPLPPAHAPRALPAHSSSVPPPLRVSSRYGLWVSSLPSNANTNTIPRPSHRARSVPQGRPGGLWGPVFSRTNTDTQTRPGPDRGGGLRPRDQTCEPGLRPSVRQPHAHKNAHRARGARATRPARQRHSHRDTHDRDNRNVDTHDRNTHV